MPEDSLPHIITSIEGKLGISIDETPTIHLIVYIPPCDNSPLRLYNGKNQRAGNNSVESFLSSKWGGIIIANPTADECSKWMANQEKVDVTINSHDIMHTALFLLRRIIDIHVDVSCSQFAKFGWILKRDKSSNFSFRHFRLQLVVQTLFLGNPSHHDHGKLTVIYELVRCIWLARLHQHYNHSFNC